MLSQIMILVGTAESSILPLLLVLSLLILTAKLLGAAAIRVGQPAVLGELLAGLILGPTFINLLGFPDIARANVTDSIYNLGQIGVIGLMFAAGLEIELNDLRSTGKPAIFGGALGVISPLIFGVGLGLAFQQPVSQSIFLGLVLSATSVSISAQTLLEMKQLRTKEGVALLGAAVIDDVLVIMLLSAFVVIASGGGSLLIFMMQLGRMLMVLLLVSLFATFILPRVSILSAQLRVSEGLLAVVFALVLLMAWVTEYLGSVAGITGAFIAGVGLGRSAHRQEIERSLHTLNFGFFVPIFLAGIGLRANVSALEMRSLVFAGALIFVAILSKVLGSSLGARLGGFSSGEAWRMGIGMVSRGEVGLIVAGIGVSENLLAQEQFTVIVLMILFTTLITPVLLRWVYKREE